MNKFYCTFGVGHRMSKYVQPIYASSEDAAITKMNEVYGKQWALPYSEDNFKADSFFNNLIELRPIYTEPVMTFGEMRTMTQRFNQIMGAGLTFRSKRLDQFLQDIKDSYDLQKDDYASRMFLAVDGVTSGENRV